jgi:hypothetical protein
LVESLFKCCKLSIISTLSKKFIGNLIFHIFLCFILVLIPFYFHTSSHSHSHSLSLTLTLILSFSFSHSHSLTLTLTLILSFSHSHFSFFHTQKLNLFMLFHNDFDLETLKRETFC